MKIDDLRAQNLRVEFAETADEIAEAQRLRYQVFARELGAAIGDRDREYDEDRFDPYCIHIVVRDEKGRVVACSRVLPHDAAQRCGGFYSQTEFDLTPVLNLPGRIMEVGRICVHTDYRRGPAIALLLAGLARVMEHGPYDYLIGCGSVPLSPDRAQALRTVATLIRRYGCPESCRVTPRHPLPVVDAGGADDESAAPALLRAYMRLGAYVGGAPCLDAAFDVADVLIILFRTRYNRRYLERLLGRSTKQKVA
ncbi:GNAT family N-acyltransferase [Acidiferrobacter sp.]|uniref:GNAT family N-acetyltransferase n=1 Tax=Acidiferrobacter sp. TaxID=1872107 RepID=UPI002607A87E|nr:GNAT family N-acyltransferase [Acidiferrobacter sp.]